MRQHALDESNRIAKLFTAEFAHLDAILKDKLVQLEQIATDKKDVEKCIKESEEKLEWLKMIQIEVESILEI